MKRASWNVCQTSVQHLQDPVFPHNGLNTPPCPSAGHLPTWTTATHSWLDSQPLRLNCCRVSITLECASFSVYLKFSHVTPLLSDSIGFPVVVPIQFKTMMLPLKHRSDHTPQRSSTSAGRLVPPSLRANEGRSAKLQLLTDLEPQWWNELPTNVRTAESLSIFTSTLYSMTPSQEGAAVWL